MRKEYVEETKHCNTQNKKTKWWNKEVKRGIANKKKNIFKVSQMKIEKNIGKPWKSSETNFRKTSKQITKFLK